MYYRLLAHFVFLTHLVFIAFVMLGGLGALRWRWIIWFHLPAASWGALIEFCGWTCPLTPVEINLLQGAGAAGYTDGFIEHYLAPFIYPIGLTRTVQWLLGAGVIVTNVFVYTWVWRRHRLGRGVRERRRAFTTAGK